MPQRGSRTRAPSRNVILDVAAELFVEVGFTNVTMQDLADRLGIAKPTLYVHARSKAAILEGIFEQVMREGGEALRRAETLHGPGDRLRAFLESWTELATRFQAHYRVFFDNERDLPAPAAQYYRRWSDEVFHRVRELVLDGRCAGIFRDDIDPTLVSFMLVALPNWTARWYGDGGGLSPTEIAGQQWDLLARGLMPTLPDHAGAPASSNLGSRPSK